MSTPVTKRISWKEFVTKTSESTGIPKKTVEEVSAGLTSTMETMVKEQRPDKIGTVTQINTPLGAYKVGYVPARTFSNPKTGEKVERPACMAISIGVPSNFIESANTGIKLGKDTGAATAEKKAKAS